MLDLIYETQDARKYVVYEKKETDQVDSVVLGMLLNNKIAGCLPFSQRQIDTGTSYCYEITGLQSLGEYFQGIVDKKKLLGVTEQILDLSIRLEEYLMDMSAVVLDVSCMYVSPENGEIYALLLPVIRQEATLEMFFRYLIFSIQYNTQEDCSYIARLLSFFNGAQEFSATAFKSLLEELKGQENHTAPAAPARQPKPVGNFNIPGSMYPSQPIPRPGKPVGEVQKTAQAPSQMTPGGFPDMPIPGNNPMTPPPKPPVQEKKGLFGKRKKAEKPEKEKKQEKFPTSFRGIAIPGAEEKNEQNAMKAMEGEMHQNIIPAQKVELVSHAVPQQNFGDTMDLSTYAMETSVLSADQIFSAQQFYLERKKTGEKFLIVKPETKVGRSKDQVDFFITDNSSIGRVHAVLYKNDGRIFVEDQSSKNGTFLNGRRVTRREEIQPGNILTLSDEEFEVKL